ncbi:MAG: hypothetical protein K0S93_613 [Nitrososphaeraceae archaeon]|nr:hypothetical protein [Nitrososphaeraceae archaeon]
MLDIFIYNKSITTKKFNIIYMIFVILIDLCKKIFRILKICINYFTNFMVKLILLKIYDQIYDLIIGN